MAPAQQLVANFNALPSGNGNGKFSSEYKVSPQQMPMFTDTAGKLNSSAAEWIAYKLMSQPDRLRLQDILVTAGYLKSADANGITGTASNDAFQSFSGVAASQNVTTDSLLAQINQGPIGQVQTQIQSQLAAAQKNATQPIGANVENPTTLSADITSAFENALGYAPDQAQIQKYISDVQGQDTAVASAPRAAAQDQINQAHAEGSALNKLGPNGIDTVIQAYQAAVNGTKMPGAGTTQGPVNGAAPNPGQGGFTAPGTQLPAGTTMSFRPGGTEVGANVLPGTQQTTQNVPQGGLLSGLTGGGYSNPEQVTTYQQRGGGPAPAIPAGITGTHPTYGGLYALSSADWAEAKKLTGSLLAKYPTPGGTPGAPTPASVQQAALNALLTNAYDANGHSMSKAIVSIASGSPFGTAEGTHLAAFGNSVAAEINNQIQSIQNQLNNSTVTVKTSAPDAVAEANLAAKQSDPSGYEAAQGASWGSVLNKMLSGTPSMYNQSSSDTFTGPVNAQAMTAQASAPTTVGAGAP
jgi:hypothetical protein